MPAAPRFYRVELLVEVPASTSAPDLWNWDCILNDGDSDYANTPVQIISAIEVKAGSA